MRKNVASQKIGAQLVSATDGSAFTGSVTVSVTGDAGTQATGSVGSGACTHEGNGYHTYAPAQAETNYDLIAFTFTGTGAVPATVQVFTRWDANVTHYGATAGTFASGRPEVNTTHIAGTSQTARDIGASVLLSSGTGTGQIDFTSGRVKADTVYWNAAAVASPHTAGYPVITIKDGTGTGELDTALGTVIVGAFSGSIVPSNFNLLSINGSGHIERVVLTDTCTTNTDMISAAGIRTAVGLASANLDTQLTTIDDFLDTEIAAIKAKTDNLPASPAATGDIQTGCAAALTAYDPPTNAEMEARTITAATYATAANLSTVAGYLDTEIAAILADTNELQTDWANGGRLDLILDARASQTSVDTIDGIVDSILDDTGTSGVVLGSDAVNATSLAATATAEIIAAMNIGVSGGVAGALTLSQVASSVTLILADTGTDGVAISTTLLNRIADHVLRRLQTNVEASSDGDTLGVGSLYGFIQQAQESDTTTNAGKLTVFKTDGTTELGQKTLTTDAAAEPITGIE